MAVPSLLETSCEGDVPRTRGVFEPVVMRSTHNQTEVRLYLRIAGAVVASLAFACAVLVIADSAPRSQHVGRIEALASILCCDGCCMSAAQNPVVKNSLDEIDNGGGAPARPTVLHFEGQKEIDYTASGNHVAQHMENALNELDDLEDHVQSGMPKYLKESAVQREADLMNHKFTRDLEGSGKKKKMAEMAHNSPLALSSKALQEADNAKSPAHTAAPAQKTLFKMQTGQKIVDQVVAAAKMESNLQRKDEQTAKAMYKESSSMLNKRFHAAEEEAKHAIASGALKPSSSSFASSSSSSSSSSSPAARASAIRPSSNHFVPITQEGLTPGPAHAKAQEEDAERKEQDVKDEEIIRQLAEGNAPMPPLTAEVKAKPVQERKEEEKASKGGEEGEGAVKEGGEGGGKKEAVQTKASGGEAGKRKASAEEEKKSSKEGRKARSKSESEEEEAGEGEKQLNGVLGRIDRLIGGYTGGANQHSTFFKHFDSDLQAAVHLPSSSSSSASSQSLAASEHPPPPSAAAAHPVTASASLRVAAPVTAFTKTPVVVTAGAKSAAKAKTQAGKKAREEEPEGAPVKLAIGEAVGRRTREEEREAAVGERRHSEGLLRAALNHPRREVSEEGRADIVNLRMGP